MVPLIKKLLMKGDCKIFLSERAAYATRGTSYPQKERKRVIQQKVEHKTVSNEEI